MGGHGESHTGRRGKPGLDLAQLSWHAGGEAPTPSSGAQKETEDERARCPKRAASTHVGLSTPRKPNSTCMFLSRHFMSKTETLSHRGASLPAESDAFGTLQGGSGKGGPQPSVRHCLLSSSSPAVSTWLPCRLASPVSHLGGSQPLPTLHFVLFQGLGFPVGFCLNTFSVPYMVGKPCSKEQPSVGSQLGGTPPSSLGTGATLQTLTLGGLPTVLQAAVG